MTRFVFDFDGVLFDTARECLAVAYRTFTGGEADPPRALASAFAQHRYLVGPPWQYAVLLRCLERGDVPSNAEAFLALAARQREELAGFTDRYFAERERLAASPRWLELVRPYETSARSFRELHARGTARILSTRDDRSITKLCAHYLGVELAKGVLLPRAGSREKWELLLDVAANERIEPSRIFFLDDYFAHALPAKQRGISAHLAAWGYLGPTDEKNALTAGLPCLQLTDLDRALRAHQENHA